MAELTRRSLITVAAAASVGALAACRDSGNVTASAGTSTAGASSSTASSSVAPASSSPTSTPGWQQLRSDLSGKLTMPSDSGFAAAHQLFDPDFDGRRPSAVVRAATRDDVVTAMKFAAAHDLRVTARSGGHSYVGASAADGALVLDLRDLADVRFNGADKSATIGAGARLYDVHRQLDRSGRTIATGTCPTVGVSGLTAGGGVGVWSRQHGLTCDALTSAEVVLPDGRVVTADSRNNEDLFWALRGAGGGAVGIVTRWTFATFAAERSGSFVLDLPADAPEQAVRGWGEWMNSAPRSQWANLHVTRTADGVSVRAVGVTADGEQNGAAQVLAKACGAPGASAKLAARSHLDTVKWLGGGTTSERTVFTAGSDVVRTFDDAAAQALVAAVRQAPSGCVAILDPLTGAVADLQPDATAFPWRRHAASVQWYSGSTAPAVRRWIAAAHRTLGSHSDGGYINYVEPGDDLARHLGSNSSRLEEMRRHYGADARLVSSVDG